MNGCGLSDRRQGDRRRRSCGVGDVPGVGAVEGDRGVAAPDPLGEPGRSDLSWDDSVRIDVRYVENWSLTFDFMILWKTAGAVLRGSGAY